MHRGADSSLRYSIHNIYQYCHLNNVLNHESYWHSQQLHPPSCISIKWLPSKETAVSTDSWWTLHNCQIIKSEWPHHLCNKTRWLRGITKRKNKNDNQYKINFIYSTRMNILLPHFHGSGNLFGSLKNTVSLKLYSHTVEESWCIFNKTLWITMFDMIMWNTCLIWTLKFPVSG